MGLTCAFLLWYKIAREIDAVIVLGVVAGIRSGRYWNPKGPQNTLYIPSSLLTSGNVPF